MSINSTKLPSLDDLRKAVDYNPETGKLTWRPRLPDFCPDDRMRCRFNRRHAGKEAGSFTAEGYLHFEVLGCTINTHRAAWAIYHGEWPDSQIDHINGKRDDNRIVNLRVVDAKANSQNRKLSIANKSGAVGVHYCATAKKWVAKIQGRRIGSFHDYAAAVGARKNAERHAGFHPNHGRIEPRHLRARGVTLREGEVG